MGQRVGIFGGTFDPIHVGHLVAAVNAKDALGLDRVLLVVANVPWQKADLRAVSSAEDRLALVDAAVGDVPGLEASRLEIDRGGESYTADTLSELRQSGPNDELFLIVGWDVAGDLATWERHEEIQRLATLVVVNRPGAGHPQRQVLPCPGSRERAAVNGCEVDGADGRVLPGDPGYS